MPWDDRNLAYTVGPRYRPMQPCPVQRWLTYIGPWWFEEGPPRPEDVLNRYHDWTDGTGRCRFCRKTRDEARKPEPPPGSSAHLERALSTGE